MEDKTLVELIQILGRENVKTNEPMKKHTTFKIGGPADYYLTPNNEVELSQILNYCKEEDLDYFILGNGSNILVKDKGYRGIIIDLSGLNEIKVEGETIEAGAGVLLKDIALLAEENSLTGYEFASGIPGSLGGAVRMNAGAYDGEHSDVVTSARILDESGKVSKLSRDDLNFSYRHSIIKEKPYTVVSATLKLKKGDKDKIRSKREELSEKRRQKQPLEYPSAGSTFKRPEGYFAGKLIQDIGFRGHREGGAAVSEKHTGFVINKDNATAEDVLNLITKIQERIKEEFGVDIEREVIVIGE